MQLLRQERSHIGPSDEPDLGQSDIRSRLTGASCHEDGRESLPLTATTPPLVRATGGAPRRICRSCGSQRRPDSSNRQGPSWARCLRVPSPTSIRSTSRRFRLVRCERRSRRRRLTRLTGFQAAIQEWAATRIARSCARHTEDRSPPQKLPSVVDVSVHITQLTAGHSEPSVRHSGIRLHFEGGFMGAGVFAWQGLYQDVLVTHLGCTATEARPLGSQRSVSRRSSAS